MKFEVQVGLRRCVKNYFFPTTKTMKTVAVNSVENPWFVPMNKASCPRSLNYIFSYAQIIININNPRLINLFTL